MSRPVKIRKDVKEFKDSFRLLSGIGPAAFRGGAFYVSSSTVESVWFHAILHDMKFVPFRVEYSYITGMFEYAGFSPEFSVINKGDLLPMYSIILNGNKFKCVEKTTDELLTRRTL